LDLLSSFLLNELFSLQVGASHSIYLLAVMLDQLTSSDQFLVKHCFSFVI